MTNYSVIGVMSGSSLDGLDICLVVFQEDTEWTYRVIGADTILLPAQLKEKLITAPALDHPQLKDLDEEYGEWIGNQVYAFRSKNDDQVMLAAVHGHTVFHDPSAGISWQLGDGATISRVTGLPVVVDFRTGDLLSGGQGAPLVPVGEYHLFPRFEGFINLGGIANFSVRQESTMRAWDVCPCNQVLNHLAARVGREYDDMGALARSGQLHPEWIRQWSKLPFIQKAPPKAMSNQWVRQEVIEKLPAGSPRDLLHSFTYWVAGTLAGTLKDSLPDGSKVLLSGGGSYNQFLVELIKEKVGEKLQLIVPEREIIDFKEALIFAFLGILRYLGRPNVFASVTGAREDTIAGLIFKPDLQS